MTTLGTFDGRDVASTSIAITRAGDGLSQALKIEPQVLHVGDRVAVVLDCEVSKIGFVPVTDTDLLDRVQTLRAVAATIVDHDLVSDALEAQALKLEKARGVERLALDADPD